MGRRGVPPFSKGLGGTVVNDGSILKKYLNFFNPSKILKIKKILKSC
jgi:hypothetical protein